MVSVTEGMRVAHKEEIGVMLTYVATVPKVVHNHTVCVCVRVNNSRHESSGLPYVTASLLHPTCCQCATPQIHSHASLLLPSLPLMAERVAFILFHAAASSHTPVYEEFTR